MTGRGRPPIGPVVTIRYPTDVLAAVDRLAHLEGITRAELLRRLADAYAKENER